MPTITLKQENLLEPVAAEFWSIPAPELLNRLNTTPAGLTSAAARRRLALYGPNLLKSKRKTDAITLLLAQFKSPIIIILLGAAILSYFLAGKADAIIICFIVVISSLLGFWQERGAANALAKLLAVVQIKAAVWRDGKQGEIPVERLVPGDIVILAAGDVIPGDCLLLSSNDLFVDEAALTGETYPAEKSVTVLPADTPLNQRINTLFMGTHVVSGSGQALVVATGTQTEFGQVSERLVLRPPMNEFERGVRRFGFLLMQVTFVMVTIIFVGNILLKRPILDSFLFAMALAVGLTPQLLPAIISVNLATGAKRMAAAKVIVRKLASIENFGSMNVLCSDKTGTITEGTVHLQSMVGAEGRDSKKVALYAYLNAIFETGFTNPIDLAIRTQAACDITGYEKLDEVPYDFIRKRLTILVGHEGRRVMITKGAVPNVLSVCTAAETADGAIIGLKDIAAEVTELVKTASEQGSRTLAVAYRDVGSVSDITKDHETAMTLLGFLIVQDPPKPGILETINRLSDLGVSLKIITGDNHLIAATIARQVGMANTVILTGQEMRLMSPEALMQRAQEADIFAEVEPNQKERIILALKKAGHVVGYMGDGINDASALHAADVGISVASAVDVAKEAADIVLLEQDLNVLVQGVQEGRKTFANTLKYVFMATSANFGNMFSMAGASLLLPFLPLLPTQILLTNLLTDFPEMTIATDSVDRELVDRPHRWDIGFIRRFMFFFGILSSVFDYLTFGALIFILRATPELFRTGWFQESVISAVMIVLVIRTRRPFIKSRPGKYLLIVSLVIIGVTLIFPASPLGRVFEFQVLPLEFYLVLSLILLLYILSAELLKRYFYRKFKY
ncbi:MAG: magnesium-translocating P-type ATPase [Deltaproteobacteria bacterium]|nr:magnesium-translocating P-type ATPase [Deltaproteobacteria bacterium]